MAWSQELSAVLSVVVYPGMGFLILLSLLYEWIDRKFVARLQNRYGPLYTGPSGILQPFADIVKLLSKEDIEPKGVDHVVFRAAPILMLALPLLGLLVVPINSQTALLAFEGDLIFMIFLLTLIAALVFLAGYASANRFGTIGGLRAALQMLGYEVPLSVSLVGPAIMAGSLSISRIVQWQTRTGFWMILMQPVGFAISILCLLAELEKIPFDIPEAETEIVAGWLTEYSGRKLALLRLAGDVEMVLACGLLAALYLGGPAAPAPWLSIVWFLVKTVAVLLIFSNLRSLFARFRIDQMISGCWKYLLPLASIQLIAVELMLGR